MLYVRLSSFENQVQRTKRIYIYICTGNEHRKKNFVQFSSDF